MILPLILAQILSAAPAAAPLARTASAPVVAAGTGQTRSLADVAAERRAGKVGIKGGTLSVAGAPVPYMAPSPAGTADEAEWTHRNAAARGELADSREALALADSQLPRYSVSGRGSAFAAAVLDQERENALLPYRQHVAQAQAATAALPEEARKAGAQPGWVRATPAQEARERALAPPTTGQLQKKLNDDSYKN